MFGLFTKSANNQTDGASAKISAIEQSFAVVEFTPSGHILFANDSFLSLTEYSLEEIIGQHHSIFLSQAETNASEYSRFWQALSSGQIQKGEYCILTKSGA